MRSLFRTDQNPRGDIESRIEMLRDEIAELSREASRMSRGAYRNARDFGQDFLADLPVFARKALPVARRQARIAEKTVRDNPTAATAVAGLVLLGLAATLIYSRR